MSNNRLVRYLKRVEFQFPTQDRRVHALVKVDPVGLSVEFPKSVTLVEHVDIVAQVLEALVALNGDGGEFSS